MQVQRDDTVRALCIATYITLAQRMYKGIEREREAHSSWVSSECSTANHCIQEGLHFRNLFLKFNEKTVTPYLPNNKDCTMSVVFVLRI